MKYFMLLFFITMFTGNGCANPKQKNINQENISIEYSAISRGLFYLIGINNKTISFQKDSNEKAITKACGKDQWNRLMNILKDVDIENFSTLKAPSEARFYDGAAIAKLKITYNDKTYETPSFDHGNPHSKIQPLIKDLLTMAENID